MLPVVPVLGLAVAWKVGKAIVANRPGRAAVLRAAVSQLGNGNPALYWADVAPGVNVAKTTSWCGAFALWALHKGGLMVGIPWQFGTGFLYRLPITLTPKPADIAYFTAYQHEAVIESVNDNGIITLLNGNGTGGVVTRSTGPMSRATAFFSIAHLVGEN